jgi:hypothetical protein
MMRLSLSLLAAAAAIAVAGCPGEDDYPRVPGGPGPPGNPVVQDAAPDAPLDGGDSGTVRSRICVITDMRLPTAPCATGAITAGISVAELGTANQTVTVAGGGFTLPVTGTGVVILEIGLGNGAVVPSLVPFTRGSPPPSFPVPSGTQYRALVADLQAAPTEGAGDVAVYYLDNVGGPLSAVNVTAPEGTLNPVFYDREGSTPGWEEGGGTGPRGAALLLTVPAGVNRVGAVGPGSMDLSLISVPVVDGHVTFATARAP